MQRFLDIFDIRLKCGQRTRRKSWTQNTTCVWVQPGGDGEIWTLAPGNARPTAFRVRTLQPLGYISKHQIRYCDLRFTLFSSVENSDEITWLQYILFYTGKIALSSIESEDSWHCFVKESTIYFIKCCR